MNFFRVQACTQLRVYKLINNSGIKVALDGRGADELLAGYRGYPVQRFQSLISKEN